MRLEVVIPARNEAAKIGRILTTLEREAARCADFCVTVVDDESDDGTANVVEGFVGRSRGRFRLKRLKERRCIGGARNAATAESEAAYVAFADADDDYEPGAMSELVAATWGEPDVIAYWFRTLTKRGERTGTPRRWLDAPVGACFKAVRREKLVPFKEGAFCEDCTWWFEQADRIDGRKAVVLPKVLYVYDRRGGGFSDAIGWLGEHPHTLEQLAFGDVLEKEGLEDRCPSDVLRCLADMYDLRKKLKNPDVRDVWKARFASIYANVMTGRWVY